MVSELVSQRVFATAAGTARYARRHADGRHATAFTSAAQLQLSSIGLGTYLGPPTDAADANYTAAVVEAVRQGVNVLDTARNYRCGRSERAIGRALAQLLASGEVFRSELLLSSKVGFVPFDGTPPADPQAWVHTRTVAAGLAEADELVAGCHCMAPAFVRAEVAASLDALGVETLDVCFVHNPETQLQFLPPEVVHARLRQTFAELEAAVERGQLRVYGVATWSGLRARPGERDHLSLAQLVRLAEDVAGVRHHFRAVQLPLNLAMPEAVARPNQLLAGELLPAIEAARRLGLVVLASGPLLQGKLAQRLPAHVAAVANWSPAETALQFARSVAGVSSALVGMARPAHVVENARVLTLPRAESRWLAGAAQSHTGAAWC
jgi:aryl-alcohol dehydrogenase-like predicted oxidoreductase